MQYIGDHVDILGRSSLNDLILRVAGGKGDLIEDNYVSRIREYADRVKIYEDIWFWFEFFVSFPFLLVRS